MKHGLVTPQKKQNELKKKVKILILCFDYPPLNSIGAQRPYAWRKYFVQNNIDTTLITRNWSSQIKEPKDFLKKDVHPEIDKTDNFGRIIKLNYKGSIKHKLFTNNKFKKLIRKTFSLLQLLLKWNFPIFDESYFIYKRAVTYVKGNKVDLILTTGEPFVFFKYAYELSKKFNIPYVLDYRDGWSSNHIKKSRIFKLINNIERKRENKYLTHALFASAASPKIIKDNVLAFKKNKFYLHENGIDLDLLNNIDDVIEFKKFTICYSGSIYLEHNVSAFISAFKKVKHTLGLDIQVIFVGIKLYHNSQVQRIIDLSNEYEDEIIIYERIPHEECVKLQLKCQLLLKFDFTGQKDNLLGAKLYEYAATRKPILTILSNPDKTTYFFPDKNVQFMTFTENEIVNEITKFYIAHNENREIKNDLTNLEINNFSRIKRIRDFSIKIHNTLKEIK